jgi:hypothetical protein
MFTVGGPLGGLLAAGIGFRPALWIAIGGMATAATVAALSPLRTARVDTAQDPEPADAVA